MSFLVGCGLGPTVCVDEGPENEMDGTESCIVGGPVVGLVLCSKVGVTSGAAEGSASDSDGFVVGRTEGLVLCCDVGRLVFETVGR